MSEAIELGRKDGYFWEIASGYDCTDFFKSLTLFLDKEAVFYIECSSFDMHVIKTLREFPIDERHSIYAGTISNKNMRFHFHLNLNLVNRLVDISENFAVPEYADHITIYSDDVHLEAYDFTTGPIYISGLLPESFVRKFAKKCKRQFRLLNEQIM